MKTFFSTLALAACFFNLSAQDSTQTPEPVGSRLVAGGKPVWIFGIHGVVVDDDGRSFSGLFDVGNAWNFNPYPSRITVERTLDKAWRVEAAASYVKYSAGKLVNDNPIAANGNCIVIDANAKYDLNEIFGESKIFDPYTVSGIGFTYRTAILKKGTPTLNLGLGCNFWLYKDFGLNLQTTAKIKIIQGSSNYLMHSVGVVYRLNFVEKGEPKQGMILESR